MAPPQISLNFERDLAFLLEGLDDPADQQALLQQIDLLYDSGITELRSIGELNLESASGDGYSSNSFSLLKERASAFFSTVQDVRWMGNKLFYDIETYSNTPFLYDGSTVYGTSDDIVFEYFVKSGQLLSGEAPLESFNPVDMYLATYDENPNIQFENLPLETMPSTFSMDDILGIASDLSAYGEDFLFQLFDSATFIKTPEQGRELCTFVQTAFENISSQTTRNWNLTQILNCILDHVCVVRGLRATEALDILLKSFTDTEEVSKCEGRWDKYNQRNLPGNARAHDAYSSFTDKMFDVRSNGGKPLKYVTPNSLLGLIQVESDGNPSASSGAYKGLMQLADETFAEHIERTSEFMKELGASGSVYDYKSNMLAGADYFEWCYTHPNNPLHSTGLAIANYNWGTGNVRSYLSGRMPLRETTKEYIVRYLIFMRLNQYNDLSFDPNGPYYVS